MTCALLLEALGAPLIWCGADHFGVLRVKRSRRAASLAAAAAAAAAAASRETWGDDDDASAAERSALVGAGAAGRGGLVAQPHEAGYTAGGFEDAVASVFAVVARLSPAALVWCRPRGPNEPLHAALALVAAQLRGQASPAEDAGADGFLVPRRAQASHEAIQRAVTAANAAMADDDAALAVHASYLPARLVRRRRKATNALGDAAEASSAAPASSSLPEVKAGLPLAHQLGASSGPKPMPRTVT